MNSYDNEISSSATMSLASDFEWTCLFMLVNILYIINMPAEHKHISIFIVSIWARQRRSTLTELL